MTERLHAAAALWPVLLFAAVLLAGALWADHLDKRRKAGVDLVVPTQRKAP